MQLYIIFFRPSNSSQSPVEKEYLKAVQQPKERAKIDAILTNMETFGFDCPGVRFEKVKGIKEIIYVLKIKAFGCEHRFLSGYAPEKTSDDIDILVLLKYIKKKDWKLDPDDIQTAVKRFIWMKGV